MLFFDWLHGICMDLDNKTYQQIKINKYIFLYWYFTLPHGSGDWGLLIACESWDMSPLEKVIFSTTCHWLSISYKDKKIWFGTFSSGLRHWLYAYGIWVRENVELEWQSIKKNGRNIAFLHFFSREKVEKARKSLSR